MTRSCGPPYHGCAREQDGAVDGIGHGGSNGALDRGREPGAHRLGEAAEEADGRSAEVEEARGDLAQAGGCVRNKVDGEGVSPVRALKDKRRITPVIARSGLADPVDQDL